MKHPHYSKKAMEHFLNPKNLGEMKNPTTIGYSGSPQCGDTMKLFIKLGKDERIEDISFQTLGCAAAIATSDMICEIAKGKSLKEASEITHQDVVDNLGSLPPTKVHCADLAKNALKSAIENYEK